MTIACFIAAAVVSVLGSLVGQTTWVVPAGASLAPTIALAAPGDILQLSGQHPGFTLNKGLVLLGPAQIQNPNYAQSFPPSGVETSVQIPAGQVATLVGIDFRMSGFLPSGVGHRVTVAGDAAFEDCQFRGSYVQGVAATVHVQAGTVILQRCLVTGFPGTVGMRVDGGTVVMTNCEVRGGSWDSSFPGVTPAVQQAGGVIHASFLTAIGGSGGTSTFSGITVYDGMPAMVVIGGASFVTDSTLTGGGGGSLFSLGQPAPALQGSGQVRVARTTLAPGTAVTGAAAPSSGFTIEPTMLGMSGSGPLRLGQTFTATATVGTAQQLLGIVGGFQLQANSVPTIVEPVYGSPAQLFTLLLVAPASSAQVPVTLNVPNVASLLGLGIWLQAVQLVGSQLRTSPLVGGVVR